MSTSAEDEEKKDKLYKVPPGTATFTGPLGARYTQLGEPVVEDLLVTPLTPAQVNNGTLGLNVEVVEPKEQKGTHIWIAQEIGRKGWIRS